MSRLSVIYNILYLLSLVYTALYRVTGAPIIYIRRAKLISAQVCIANDTSAVYNDLLNYVHNIVQYTWELDSVSIRNFEHVQL